MEMNRKSATKLLLVQWSRFQNVEIRMEGSTLFTGVNGSGKSTILDAMTYLLTGNTQFNKAAKDRDRTVLAYVRGDTKSNGPSRYLRTGEVVSYIAMEFWSPVENAYLVVGVCIESANETAYKPGWFICRNAKLSQMNFTGKEGTNLKITPRNELAVDGKKLKSGDFLGRDRGVEQVLRALGLRCDAAKYRSKLLKMMAFNPENNIDQFIQECVLEPGKVESLKELREQKRQFEHIKEMYENLRDSKIELEQVELRAEEYERKLRNYHIRDMMFSYQLLREKQEEEKQIHRQLEALEHKVQRLEEQKADLDKRYEAAGERYRIAENNDIFRGMQDSIRQLEYQEEKLGDEILRWEEKLAVVKKLQMQLVEILNWVEEYLELTPGEKKYLAHISEKGYGEDTKVDVFLHFSEKIMGQDRIFAREEVHIEDRIRQLAQEIDELEEAIKSLEANIMVYPAKVENARRIIREELEKQGIHTEVRLFAELVQSVKDAGWRSAIETFLGYKRFDIIVDGAYCHKAMEVLEKRSIHDATVVITDKLPDVPITSGSAAEILNIPNIYARRYANYLLNGIHLCETLEELHEYPKGGLMKNGMLAKSYRASRMDMRGTSFCLGEDSVRHRLKQAKQEKKEKVREQEVIRKELDEIRRNRKSISNVNWDVGYYDFQAEKGLEEAVLRQTNIRREMEQIRKNPDFLAVIQEQQDARRQFEEIRGAVETIAKDIGGCETECRSRNEQLKELAGAIHLQEKEYEELRLKHMELQRPMLEEYEKMIRGKDTWQAITKKTVTNLEGEVKECIRKLEDAQLKYCKLAETDINKRGVAYIPYYREEYRNIANIKVEEAHNKLKEQGEKLESAFMNDFVAEINETVREAKREIDVINRELKQIPFGNDTYRFVMKEKADRSVFFRICRRLEEYMDSPEVYMNSAREDEEMERDIQEFMSVILEEEDETEYTDYRKYFVYDMEISSKQGKDEVIADLSKKQGSASNGEKQTPYFIILAASLIQYYPKNVCCARLAFIDEAFSALSRERIEQMVKYFEDNHFQVFYAAPPEKIGSIGAFIDSTVSLVISGRYTHGVEGLMKENYS